ncbi:hypothetical protein [Croceicoccus mobilis]|uniref:Heme exporter protein D n=1 Tax=Croceicoccus mobilis TaxID=1703339 RepID=A0A917DTE5_9SPHN|nr:hypothetical protein [Croceicoccus mobilis]GGD65337.1 hypothetical protein GCM10010990_13550 [Croceicoccus mobilis]
MPLWIELTVLLLIVYFAVLAIMASWLRRGARLARLTSERTRRQERNIRRSKNIKTDEEVK